MKVLEITQNRTGKVRDTLCVEDVRIPEFELLKGFGLVNLEIIDGEKVLWLKESVRVPRFNKFYASRIGSTKDPYLLELTRMLLYLNPNPDTLLIKKITEFIILRFSRIRMVESELKVGEMAPKPVLTFEEVEPVVRACSVSRMTVDDEYLPDNEVPVLFQRDSKFSKGQKISIRSEYRGYTIKEKLESVIHNAAELLIEEREFLKVTNAKIKDTGLVETSRGVASLNTIAKYMGGRTQKVIDVHNEVAPFKTEVTEKAYAEFLKISGQSVRYIANELGVSNNTVLMFRKLEERGLIIKK